MKKNYKITDMCCGGCVINVKLALTSVHGVDLADFQLNPQSAVITQNQSIEVKELQACLSKVGNYTI
jgi:copper chaperone CopZ